MRSLNDFILFQGAYHPEERWPFPSFPKLPWQHCRQKHRPSAMWSFGKAPAIAAMPSKTMALKQQHHGTSRAACHWLRLSHAAMIEPWKTTFPNINAYVCRCLLSYRTIFPYPSSYLLLLSIVFMIIGYSLTDTHTYTYYGSVPNEASLLWLPARRLKVTGSSLSSSCKGLKNRLYGRTAAVAAMQLLGKKQLIQLMLSCCCGKSLFLLHVF